MLHKLSWLTLSSFFIFCIGCVVNPISGEQELMLFSPDHDIALGRKYAPEVEQQMGGED